MSTLSPKEVGDLMTQYAAQPCPVAEAFPRYTNKGIDLFDRGHYRKFDRENPTIRGQRIKVVQTPQGVAPEGFVPVPERVILKHFVPHADVNANKLEDAVLNYKRAHDAWLSDPSTPEPRRPTLQMLRLHRGSEFENFFKPLIMPYARRLQASFERLLYLCDTGGDVFDAMNKLYLPNGNTDNAVQARWNKAVEDGKHKYIYVHLPGFAALSSIPDVNESLPTLIAPFGTQKKVESKSGDTKIKPSVEMDADLLGKGLSMGGVFKNDFLLMAPWKDSQRKPNPFKSKEYKRAWRLVQVHFEERYKLFKRDIEARRREHARKWEAFRAYKNAMQAYHYTKQLNVPYAEKPQTVHFTLEWQKFIFGLREEMKTVQFEAVDDGFDSDSSGEDMDAIDSEIDANSDFGLLRLRPRMLMI